MSEHTPQAHRREAFVLGDWRVYPDQNTIEADADSVHLEPRVMEVLCYLADHAGEVVNRSELISELWQGTYATDESLSRVISLLRGHLGDDSRSPRFIATVPKVGYRLIMPVSPLVAATPQADPVEPASPVQPEPVVRNAVQGPSRVPGKVLVGAAVLLMVILVQWFNRSSPAEHDPYSPALFEDLSDWFEFLVDAGQNGPVLTDIAVLPFDDISENAGNAFFSDGLTDELISTLGKTRGLNVVARSSSLSFRNRYQDVRAIGSMLGVNAVIEGTVKRAGDRIRVSCQLSGTADGYVIWSEVYDRELSDLLNLQAEIAAAIVGALESELGVGPLQSSGEAGPAPSMAAYQAYLNARFLAKLRGEQPLRRSIELYRQALRDEPGFTRAQLGLASSLALLPSYTAAAEEEMFAAALQLLDGLRGADATAAGEAQAIRGFIAFRRWQWLLAEEHFRSALVLDPANANTYSMYSQLLAAVGRLQDSLKAARKAHELDAVSPVINQRLATAYLWTGDNVRAAEQFALGRELGYLSQQSPEYLMFLLRMQRYPEARAVIDHLSGDAAADWVMQNIEAISAGRASTALVDEAEAAVLEGGIMPRLQVGLWLLLGEPQRVYDTVLALQDNKKSMDFELLFALEASSFRQTRQFKKLAEKSGLDEYWATYSGPDFES